MTLALRPLLSSRFASLATALGFVAVVAGCPSKEGEQKDAQGPGPAASGGPLANLETQKAVQEAWTIDGQPAPMLYYAADDVRISASCQKGPGPLACDALRQVRVGAPVEIPRR